MSYNVKYTTNANVTVTVEDTGRTELGQSSVTTRLNPSKVNKIASEWIFFRDISGILGIPSLHASIFVV